MNHDRENVADLIRDHIVLEVDSIDRMYLNGYVPLLQTEGGFVRDHLGYPIASTAVIAPMTERFVQSIERFAQRSHIDVVAFEKGERKDDVAKEYLAKYPLPKGRCLLARPRTRSPCFEPREVCSYFPICR